MCHVVWLNQGFVKKMTTFSPLYQCVRQSCRLCCLGDCFRISSCLLNSRVCTSAARSFYLGAQNILITLAWVVGYLLKSYKYWGKYFHIYQCATFFVVLYFLYGSKYLSVSDSLCLKTLMVLVVQVCWWQFYKLSLFEKVSTFLSCVLSVYECLWDFSVLLILSNLIAMRLVFIMFL